MEKEMGKVCAGGLAYFGQTNRLISHELKNVLAIISETVGLLDELLEMHEKGMELKPAKLRSMSKSILEEVERANTVIRGMNALAHSVDEFIGEVDLKETVSLVIKLAKLNSNLKTIKIDFQETDSHIIHTSPFFLQNLLYEALYFTLAAAGSDRHVRVSLDPGDDEIRVGFYGFTPDISGSFPTGQAALLAKAIGAEITNDRSAGQLHIVLPKRMTGGPIQALLAK